MIKKEKFPFLLIVLFYILFFITNQVDWLGGDALWFSKVNSSPLTFAIDRYETWSSRFWIEGAVLLSSKNLLIFFILTIVFIFLLFYSISQLISFNKFISNLVLVLVFIILFPMVSLKSAGLIATIVNYVWPSALFAYWLMIDRQRNSEEKIAIYKIVIATFSLILSIFNEGLAIVLFLYLIIQVVIEKKEFLNPYRIVCLLVSLLSILNVLLCPGNQKRGALEMVHWFPTFNHLSFFDKLLIQFNNIASNLIVSHNFIEILFLLLLLRAVQKRQILSVILSAVLIMLSKISQKLISDPLSVIVHHSSEKKFNYNITGKLLGPSVIFMIMLAMIVFVIILLDGKSKKSFVAIGSLAVTFSAGMAISLSPTLLASSDRPLLFLYFVIIFNCAILADDIIGFNKSKDSLNPVEEISK
ncbi:hypothetical protein [Lactococcus lactis]|uniref:hypothetical protein n=1 Tax=Lactococcus lactis TaxID=1358 RepID=UPI003D1079AA